MQDDYEQLAAQLQNTTPIILMGVKASSEGVRLKQAFREQGKTCALLMSDDPRLFRLPNVRLETCWLDFSFYMPRFKGKSLSPEQLKAWAKDALRDANYDVVGADEWEIMYSPPSDEQFRVKLTFRWNIALDSLRVVTFVHDLDNAVRQAGGHY